jgi:acylphosphatase
MTTANQHTAHPHESHNTLHAIVKGNVQGVGFRVFTRAAALRHNCTGWVRNLDDGSVEVYAEGDELDLTELLTELYQGPPWAHVSDIDMKWESRERRYESFTIER